MKNLLRSFSLLLAVVLLASLCACRLQETPQPSDEASAPTVPSEEPTAPVTEKLEPATEPSGETEPYVIDDETFEIFSELDSTYWYIGSDPTITLKDFGLKITLPDGWVDRVEIIRNASQDDLELYIGNSALMLAYDMESADPDIKGSDGYFDWVLCVNGVRKDNYIVVEDFDQNKNCIYLGENRKYRFYFKTTDMHDMDCDTFMILREMMIRKEGQEYYDNLVGDLTCTEEQAREILRVIDE